MSRQAQVGGWRGTSARKASAGKLSGRSAVLWHAGKPLSCSLFHKRQPNRDPGARFSGPGLFFAVAPLKIDAVPRQVLEKRTLTSYIRPEWKCRLGTVTDNEEQLP